MLGMQGTRTAAAIMRRMQRCATEQQLQKATPEALAEMSDGMSPLTSKSHACRPSARCAWLHFGSAALIHRQRRECLTARPFAFPGLVQLARMAPDNARQSIVNLSSEITRRLSSTAPQMSPQVVNTLRTAESKLAQMHQSL
jgi:hypothetical protein